MGSLLANLPTLKIAPKPVAQLETLIILRDVEIYRQYNVQRNSIPFDFTQS